MPPSWSCSATARNCGSQAARPMPSLRIASTGASIESARTTRTPCGSCSRSTDIRRPTIGTIRTSASSASRASASSEASASSSRWRSRANPVDPSQRSTKKTVSIRSARAPGSAATSSPRGLQVRGGDAGLDRGLAGGREAGQRAQLVGVLLHVAAGHRNVAVEGRLLAVGGADVEGNLLAIGDHRAESRRGLGGEAFQGFVEQEITHGSGFRPPPRLLRLHAALQAAGTGFDHLSGGGPVQAPDLPKAVP